MNWVKALPEKELWNGEMKRVVLNNLPVLLIKQNDTVFAFRDECPHEGAPLSEGRLGKDMLTCQMHGWQFCVSTGAGINPASSCLFSYATKTEGDSIFVDVDGKGASR